MNLKSEDHVLIDFNVLPSEVNLGWIVASSSEVPTGVLSTLTRASTGVIRLLSKQHTGDNSTLD
eukprot:m.34850 g.34850  ORF g.34850 m.34850 type:complete len:64 (-) comp7377_c0_seq2:460-651(-)